ncbi:type VI secretion system-associated protein TagF [Neptunomonas sp.]|uniref:type VI secretion system-associated protein TagF n=1 Tax=Neptunomonas sp. TaxID=1971898 RepID=UPI0025D28F98|nr:type VI secretion system-associated protein TagF [Neptunomonas sp.]
MAGLVISVYGKLPSHADFVSHCVDPELTSELYDWTQQVVFHSKENMGETSWLTAYLISPVWRFYLPETEQRKKSIIGVMIPSVDAVGRYFPMFLVFEIDAQGMKTEWLYREANPLFSLLEGVGIQALQERLSLNQVIDLLEAKTSAFDLGESLLLPKETQKNVIHIEELLEKPLSNMGDVTLWWSAMELNGFSSPLCSFSDLPTVADYQFLLTGQ